MISGIFHYAQALWVTSFRLEIQTLLNYKHFFHLAVKIRYTQR